MDSGREEHACGVLHYPEAVMYGDWLQTAGYLMGHRYTKKTKEQLEKELEELKKAADQRVEMHILERRIYLLQTLITLTEDDIETAESDLAALDSLGTADKNSSYWAVTNALVSSRLQNNASKVEAHKQELAELIAKLKDYAFAMDRKGIDEDIRELEEEEKAPIDVEEAPASAEPTGDTT